MGMEIKMMISGTLTRKSDNSIFLGEGPVINLPLQNSFMFPLLYHNQGSSFRGLLSSLKTNLVREFYSRRIEF